jgi:PPM family protein phosphatase
MLPRRDRSQAAGHSDPEAVTDIRALSELTRFRDHRSHRHIVRSGSRLWPIAVHEKKLIYAIRRSGQKVAMETKHIAVAGIDTCDGVAAHELDFMSDSDARYGRSSDVVVGNQERICDRTEHPNLMANVGQIRARGGLDFTDDFEAPGHRTYITRVRTASSPWELPLFPIIPLDSHPWVGFTLLLVDDLMAIGEFSERSGLSAKRLRTYAGEGLLAPAAVDPGSGYRYYAPGQLAEALVIDALRQVGVPLADIRAFLRQPSQEQLDVWARQLETEANHRQGALILARQLLADYVDPSLPIANRRSKERLMTRLRAAGRTDIGRLRQNNEDVIVISERLALVADGMGGHPGGEVAANVVAGVIPASFTGQSVDELEATIRAANWAIRDRAVAHPGLEGMGTTICAVGLLTNGQLALVNVGDSRAYLWHGNALSQLTHDHSVTAELIDRGELREEDAAQHPYYGVLTRALGVGSDVEIDHGTLAVDDGDRIVVCSDGLFNELSGEEIARTMAGGGDVAALVDDLVERAVAHGGRDNVSVVIAEVAA